MSYESKPDILIARRGYSDTSGVTDTVKSIASGIFGLFTGKARSEGEAEANRQLALQQRPATDYTVPIAIGAASLVAVLLISRRKK